MFKQQGEFIMAALIGDRLNQLPIGSAHKDGWRWIFVIGVIGSLIVFMKCETNTRYFSDGIT
jgi:hypothetical protein